MNQASGGTGLGTSGAAGNFLRSDGTNWTTSPLQVSDIPNLNTNFIQNTTITQPTSNFAISGTGDADVFNAATQFNIRGNRVLTVTGFGNLFAGIGAGSNGTGDNNLFFGTTTGGVNTTGSANSFFGSLTGGINTTGGRISFFGA